MSYYDIATVEELVEERAEFSTDWVDQRPSAVAGMTAGMTVVVRGDIEVPFLDLQTIPQSFWRALADFEAGRVVDDETALNQPPPGA